MHTRTFIMYGVLAFGSSTLVLLPNQSIRVHHTVNKALHQAGGDWRAIPRAILFYDRASPYYEFTNFYAAPITIDGVVWPTTEHYFQAQKFTDPVRREYIRSLKTARDAFKEGKSKAYPMRSNWDAVKLSVMRKAVYEKFKQHPRLQALLLKTDTRVLVENAGANDAVWGAGPDGKGKNYLGIILMDVRHELSQQSKRSKRTKRCCRPCRRVRR